MAKRLNWEKAAKAQKISREGAKFGYDELPSVGSRADQARYFEKKGYTNAKRQKKQIRKNKGVASSKDLVGPLRQALNAVQAELEAVFDREQSRLKGSESWQKISPEQRHRLAQKFNLQKPVPLQFARDVEINSALRENSLANRRNIVQTLPQRFQSALEEAARLLLPQATRVSLPTAIIRNQEELDEWFRKVINAVQEELKKGPVIV